LNDLTFIVIENEGILLTSALIAGWDGISRQDDGEFTTWVFGASN
jgi:hypothetical protein